VDLVPDDALRLTPEQVSDRHRADWRSLLAVEPAATRLQTGRRLP
jgi:hypothetical protein